MKLAFLRTARRYVVEYKFLLNNYPLGFTQVAHVLMKVDILRPKIILFCKNGIECKHVVAIVISHLGRKAIFYIQKSENRIFDSYAKRKFSQYKVFHPQQRLRQPSCKMITTRCVIQKVLYCLWLRPVSIFRSNYLIKFLK